MFTLFVKKKHILFLVMKNDCPIMVSADFYFQDIIT